MDADKRKFLDDFRKANKEKLFLPIFYTLIFGLGIFAVISLPNEDISGQKWIYYLFFAFIIILNWFLFWLGKRNEKKSDKIIEQIENDELTGANEEKYLTPKQAELVQKSLRSIIGNLVYLYVAVFAISAFSLLNQFFELSGWQLIGIICALIINLVIAIALGIIKYLEIQRFLKDIDK